MSNDNSIEITAASVEEAIAQALSRLGAEEADVEIEVLATPRSGVLGLGSRQARVRVKRRPPLEATSGVQSLPPAPPPRAHSAERESRPPRREPQAPRAREPQPEESEAAEEGDAEGGERKSADLAAQGREASDILARVLELMGEKAQVSSAPVDGESIELDIKGDGSGILIGRHGQTLDALEYIVNRIVARRIKDAAPVSVETESYRARRRQQLHRMALSMGERAKREHQPVRLEPMPPRDRRIVHLALKDDPLITTRSAGDGFLRSIEIVPTERRGERERERGEGRGGGGRRPKRDEPLGEQGGFKHGQKRIV
jgi:spoIIIJ-associated protein